MHLGYDVMESFAGTQETRISKTNSERKSPKSFKGFSNRKKQIQTCFQAETIFHGYARTREEKNKINKVQIVAWAYKKKENSFHATETVINFSSAHYFPVSPTFFSSSLSSGIF